MLDLHNHPPRMADLAGPRPDLLLTTRHRGQAAARATTLACLSSRGGSGKTTLSLNVGARLAEHGLRVLLIAVGPADGSLDSYISDHDAAASSDGFLLYHNQLGGHLRLTTAFTTTAVHQLAEHLDQVRDQADVLLLDGSYGTRDHLAQVADDVFTCVTLVNEVFGIYETTYSDRYQAYLDRADERDRRLTEVFNWLDASFEHYLLGQDDGSGKEPQDAPAWLTGRQDSGLRFENFLGAGTDEADLPSNDPDAWITTKQQAFLDEAATVAATRFPHQDWPSTRAGWIRHRSLEFDEPETANAEVPDDDEDFDIAEDDIRTTFVPHDDIDVINNLTGIIYRDGVTDADVRGHVLCTVATASSLDPEQQQRLSDLGPACTPPIVPAVVSQSKALQWSCANGELHVLSKHDAAAQALRVIGDTLFHYLARG